VIKNSFLLLDKIGEKKETDIWKQGITTWKDFIEAPTIVGLSPERKFTFDMDLKDARQKLFVQDYNHFTSRLPTGQHWRLYDLLSDECCFLDIETTGYHGDITVIGIYDGRDTKLMVKGFNLSKETFMHAIAPYKLIVTFNGASFDLPAISKYFQIKFDQVHIDLRYVCSKIGLNGGLKKIEKELGVNRNDGDMGGAEAVYLWRQWINTRDREYLDRLLRYNEEDIINLKPIADQCIKELWIKTFPLHHTPALDSFSREI
jgi:uncharacterized protein